jgi:hypothetical protein
MDERTLERREHPVRGALFGAALILVGALTLGFLVFVSNSQEPGAERLMMSLGLAGSAMLSATAQGLIFWGAWRVWKAARRRAR